MTWYNLLSDQFTGLNAIPVPGTLLRFIDDKEMRRGTLTQLNRAEGRHSVAQCRFQR